MTTEVIRSVVMKFGGTSVGDATRIAQVARILRDFREGAFPTFPAGGGGVPAPVVVVSAMSGVTDLLLTAARAAMNDDGEVLPRTAKALQQQHQTAIKTLFPAGERRAHLQAEVERLIASCESLCRAVRVLGELTPRGSDAIVSLGERLSARVVAAAMNEAGVAAQAVVATELILTDDNFGGALPQLEPTRARTRTRLLPLLREGVVPVVTGFIGATAEGVTTTLGRGGSDYSAAILGACLDSDEIWIWTDVDGVLTTDPRVVPEARTLPRISYAEAAELSYFGAKVLHPRTMLPAMEQNIPLRILNSFQPDHPGTLVVAEVEPGSRTVKAITSIKGLSLVTVEGRGMMGVPGIAARVFSAVARQGISVLMISQSSSEQSICFVIRETDTPQALTALEAAFETEMARRNVDRVWAQEDVAIVAVVGAGMRGTPGISAKVFGALGRQRINVVSIAQGSSEFNLSLVVEASDADPAVRSIHSEFSLAEEPQHED